MPSSHLVSSMISALSMGSCSAERHLFITTLNEKLPSCFQKPKAACMALFWVGGGLLSLYVFLTHH